MLGVLFVLAVMVLMVSPFFGSSTVGWSDVFSSQESSVATKIFWQIRLPRVLVSFLAGATFALCGMVFQALFRNPLVSPSTLGVSTGASLGASVYIWLGLSFSLVGISGVSIFAFLGALLSILIVWSLARVQYNETSTARMLLAGVAVSFFFASLIIFIQYLSDVTESFKITRWLMGGLFVFGYKPLFDILPFVLIGCGTIWYFTNELNVFATGEETAQSRGVDVSIMVKIIFVLVSLIIGGLVAVCGPIAFIGIIAPHIARLLIGSDHRYLTPATFLFGGLFLTLCDTIARTVIAPVEIPVGVLTALLGGPFFLWMLRR
ncbi:MAG: iron ABC transporter permease [Candidatus Omnitrophica bacterium]|nr:iron ABC transporter permease [Candidatus Omnitrophota bacterium]